MLIDENGFNKKGKHSVGVARQWNGRQGKVNNCQVGVFASQCCGRHSTLIDSRLYLPNDPAPKIPKPTGRSDRRPSKPKTDEKPVTVEAWVKQQPPNAWRRVTLHGREKGPLGKAPPKTANGNRLEKNEISWPPLMPRES
ncbi:MAG: transposase [Candidatus Thiodiazotropha sp. (ex Epidulcina cf. delphinae)]|nr:transposase [Candidatus Thiodiazotropha sp. (ex Epidulcina cf. delphinae)]